MRMLDFVGFKFCPRCGAQQLQPNDAKSFACLSCGFVYYHGSAAVAVGIIEYEDKIILTQRASEPQKGLLALPGGFVDYEESLEGALIRELHEELNLTIASPTYLCSHWERYLFRDVVYFTCIAFYIIRVDDISGVAANDDIDAFQLVRPSDIDYSKLAFESDRDALDRYIKQDRHSTAIQSA
jgi:NADH pyrophosphatase NudC (nudix superfamily)